MNINSHTAYTHTHIELYVPHSIYTENLSTLVLFQGIFAVKFNF